MSTFQLRFYGHLDNARDFRDGEWRHKTYPNAFQYW
jgi:hypothetical protein